MVNTAIQEIPVDLEQLLQPWVDGEVPVAGLNERLFAALCRPAHQQPVWPDRHRARAVCDALRRLPPITLPGEVDRLRDLLALVSRGEAFLLQGGDCAETFAQNTSRHVQGTTNLLRQLGLMLSYGARKPVVKVARLAGQYAKPRSRAADGDGLPSYRGDIVNAAERSHQRRTPDPNRMLEAYRQSTTTMNLLRALTSPGGADLREVHDWNENWLRHSRARDRFAPLCDGVKHSLDFMSAHARLGPMPDSPVFTSHEAMLLDYERALTRVFNRGPDAQLYDLSGHFLWIGERTRQPHGAHIAFAAILANPIGVKLGPSATPDDVEYYLKLLNPDNVPGRLTLITRMGAGRIRRVLPPILERVAASGSAVIWQCDPMHGNTRSVGGIKTRDFDDIVDEVQGFFEVHRAVGTIPGGIHLELTGEDVTECVGGSQRITAADLGARYDSACDPRLNREQALELGCLIAEMLSG
jgi:3-deoxy-7-phosphoheptulonate synthase